MATINIGEIVATTLRNRSGQLADNVLNHNSLCARLLQKGNVKPVSGGREIIQELEYAENGTSGWYSGYEVLDIPPSEVFDAARMTGNSWQATSPSLAWKRLKTQARSE